MGGGGGQYKDLARLLFRAGFITLTSTCLRIHKEFIKEAVFVNIPKQSLTRNM